MNWTLYLAGESGSTTGRFLQLDDTVSISIDNIGTLENKVERMEAWGGYSGTPEYLNTATKGSK